MSNAVVAEAAPVPVLSHGGLVLPAVTVETYNEELRDDEGFVGDRASGRAFRAILDDWREKVKGQGEDPFGDTPTREISKSKLDKVLAGAGVLWPPASSHTAIEEFLGMRLATVVRRFQEARRLERHRAHRDRGRVDREPHWSAGDGTRRGDAGRRGRAKIELQAIANHPDEAGLIGAVQLSWASWVLAGHDAGDPRRGRHRWHQHAA